MEPVRLAKAFKYMKTEAGKGAIFHGAVLADKNGLYLIHNKHTWESATTATAAFGLLGALIHHFATRNKGIEYPFPTLPVSEIGEEFQVSLGTSAFKDTAEVSIIPAAQIRGYSTSKLKGSKFFVGDIEIVLIGASAKTMKQLPRPGFRARVTAV